MAEKLKNPYVLAFAALFLLSIPLKLYTARLLVWEIDYVPIIVRGQAFFNGGAFPLAGTLSSVAAYNMPLLVWMHMPAMLLTRSVPAIFISTLLVFNFISTLYVYKLGALAFDRRAGLLAAVVFTFGESGVSGAYTAWAQLLLPGFFAIVAYYLLRWLVEGCGRFIAFAIIVTTAAFMTHFSAVLLYGVIVVLGIIGRGRLAWKGIAAGVIVSALLIAPYLVFEAGRDFVDLRAFLSRTPTIPRAVLDQYAYLKPEGVGVPPAASTASPEQPPAASDTASSQPSGTSLADRILRRILDTPGQVIDGLMVTFNITPDASTLDTAPALYWLVISYYRALAILFFAGTALALYGTASAIRAAWLQESENNGRLWRLSAVPGALTGTSPGRILLVVIAVLAVIAGLIVTRAPASSQATYYYGLATLQFVVAAYAAVWLVDHAHFVPRLRTAALAGLIALAIALPGAERLLRTQDHLAHAGDDTPFNTALYSSIDASVAWIASDWPGGNSLTVSYDIMPESRRFWWVVPWHTVDPLYTIGMAYDDLLKSDYGLENRNQSPAGQADGADYVVVYAAGLARYDTGAYAVHRFGAIYVLKQQ